MADGIRNRVRAGRLGFLSVTGVQAREKTPIRSRRRAMADGMRNRVRAGRLGCLAVTGVQPRDDADPQRAPRNG